MARPSPLTVIVIGLSALVLVTAIYVAGRAMSGPGAGGAGAGGEAGAGNEVELPPRPQARLPEVAPAPPALPAEEAAPPPPPPLEADDVDLAGAGGGGGPDAADPGGRKRALLTDWHSRWRQEADDNVMTTMKLPDTTRAAIHKINEDATARALAAVTAAASPDGGPGPRNVNNFAADAAAERARREALTGLLGPTTFADFDTAERVALQRLRGKYRFERAHLFQR